MSKAGRSSQRIIPAFKVNQWLEEWDEVDYDRRCKRSKPDPFFFLFKMDASELKALTGIQRRSTASTLKRAADPGIQRRHEKKRSLEIADYVIRGYPWSGLNPRKRESEDYKDFYKPGWLPTAIVVNILKPEDRRRGKRVARSDIVEIDDSGDQPCLLLPKGFQSPKWKKAGELHPIQVIDGQHRLWAFEEINFKGNFELPVVAFHGLDISWEAYLFWTINIKPKRIDPSLAYDLYPLLRTEDWLGKDDEDKIYRETRSQELVEALWGIKASPWFQWINMLGDKGNPMVGQAAWVRSLIATMLSTSRKRKGSIPGLFLTTLDWSRAQQAAFLIYWGSLLEEAIKKSRSAWATSLRQQDSDLFKDPAFFGKFSLLNMDQGIRAILHIANDFIYINRNALKLDSWVQDDRGAEATDEQAVIEAVNALMKTPVKEYFSTIAHSLSSFDWRTSSAKGLNTEKKHYKAAYRGSGGYRLLRLDLTEHIAKTAASIRNQAQSIIRKIGKD